MRLFPEAKILDIDLSERKFNIKKFDPETYRKFPGGSALGMYILLKDLKPKVDPLSEENILIFSVSLLTGLPISGQSRMTVTTKSPLTGGAADSQAGGYIPIHIKANGYDSIVFRGKSEKPVYVYIDKDKVEFKDAGKAWGKVTGETEEIIKQELKEEKVEIAQIGPAGENLVKYACIINDRSRANGRNGVGAVMGSKNLKALVIKKQKPPKPLHINNFKNLTKNILERIYENKVILDLGENGTNSILQYHNEEGFLPTNNWQKSYFGNKSKKINSTTIKETVLKARETCYACAIRCKRVVEIEGKVDKAYGGPEYETCATFGSYCGISNLSDICLANQLCNMYGLDTISCGATIAFAMECYEKGLLTKKDTNGLELVFGNGSILEKLIPKIAYRSKGIGELLAEGSYTASKVIGNGAEEYSMTCKKQEIPAHMPQMKQNLALIYAVNPYGADHQSVEHDTVLMEPPNSKGRKWLAKLGDYEDCNSYKILDKNKVKFAFETQKYYSMLDSLCLCQFAWGPAWQLYGPEDLLFLCKYGVGWDTSIEELMAIGERRINMMRYFNAREGFTKKNDKIPERLFKPLTDGSNKGAYVNKEDFELAKEYYYELAGWDKETGNPTDDVLKKLDIFF